MASLKLWGTRIAIHAAQKPMAFDLLPPEIQQAIIDHDLSDPPYGAVVATAVLLECRQVPDGSLALPGMDAQAIEPNPYGDYSPGRWIWYLTDIEPLDVPIPARGRQGFWECPLTLPST